MFSRKFNRLALLFLSLFFLSSSVVWAQKKSKTGSCIVSEIRNIGLYTYDIPSRIQLAREWLQNNVANCSEIQLRLIISNRGSWLGHADTFEISSLLDGLYEAKVANKPELMAELFEKGSKSFTPAVEIVKNPARPEMVVTPAPIIMLPQGNEGQAVPMPMPMNLNSQIQPAPGGMMPK